MKVRCTYGSLLELTVVRSLLDQIEDLLRQLLVGLGPGGGVVFSHFVDVLCKVLGLSGVVVS
jgi:hypothetical protein